MSPSRMKETNMRQIIYDRVAYIAANTKNYISTKDLLREGVTNRQIANLQEEGCLEKIVNGLFWYTGNGQEKPANYKAIEIGKVNPNAVICAETSCYLQGLIDMEPNAFTVATRRSDRQGMNMPFATRRHYFADSYFDDNIIAVETAYGNYRMYNLERSVCDCIRFREEIESDIYETIILNHKRMQEESMVKRMLAYAKAMKFERKMREDIM